MTPVQETTLEINLKALENNYTYLRGKIPNTSKFMGVVKAYAYGTESQVIGHTLVELGAEYLAVSYAKEGMVLRADGITVPILVFHPQPVQFQNIIENNLTPTLYNWRTLRAFVEIIEKRGIKNYPVHLNLNTGMNRLGFEAEAMEDLGIYLSGTPALSIEGIYSHFVASEDPDEKEFTNFQIEHFLQMSGKLRAILPGKPLLHLCNTSGILNYPEAYLDMVRAGIGLYGYGNNAMADRNLIPVATLKAPITQIHHLQKGDSAGYNRQFKATKKSRIAILELGYADGLYRAYGNGKAAVMIHGKRAPLVGNVCMGMALVDVTELNCEEGDEVVIFGPEHSAVDVARAINTISYELMAGISQRVKRVVVKN